MPEIKLSVANTLPADAGKALLAGRVWRPDVAGPSVVIIRDDNAIDITAAFPTMRDLCETADPAGSLRRRQGRNDRQRRRHSRQHAAGPPRPQQAVAAGAARSAGGESRRRHLHHLAAGTRDRGARARRLQCRGRDPGRSRASGRQGSARAQARLAAGDGSQARADRAGRLEPVSRSRHRAGRGDLHQDDADGVGRHRHGCRPASEVDLEQSGAGSRDGRFVQGPHCRRRRSATTSICAISRAARRCC